MSMFCFSIFLISCGVESSGQSGSQQEGSNTATLSWEAPTTNLNGTPLNDLAGYKVYYGVESGNYAETIDVGATSCQEVGLKTECTTTIDNLNTGKYYFAVTAYDTSGNESSFSDEGSKIFQ